jgi:hypothetical protein
VQLPSFTTRSGLVLGFIAGVAGGAVAIAVMELLAERTTFPLLFVPFETSIVLVMGSPEAEPAQPRALVAFSRRRLGSWCSTPPGQGPGRRLPRSGSRSSSCT